MSPSEKLREGILLARRHLSPEIGEKLLALVTPEAIAIMAGMAGVWAAGHFFGFSEVVDLALVGVGAFALGSEAITAGEELSGFITISLQSKSESELDEAGRHLARFVSIVGVDTVIALLLHKAVGKANRVKALASEELTPGFAELKPGVQVRVRADVSLSGAGRSGENVKFLSGPPNSAVKSVAPGRVFVTNAAGQVILDITAQRAKSVGPYVGFGEKRQPTAQELKLIKRLWGE